MYKSKVVSGIIICFLILSSLLVFFNGEQCKASGETIWVDYRVIYHEESDGSQAKPYKDIQSAINAASDGDTVVVLSGTYSGELIIDKSITLRSEDVANTIITSGAQNAYMIDITADSVSLEGFTMRDTTTMSHRKAVIHVAPDTDDVVIIDSVIEHSFNGYGIYLDNTNKTVVKDNTVNDTRGINVENSNANSIYSNNVGNCTGYPALRLASSNTNRIEENIFSNSNYGIYAQGSSDNAIKNNTVIENDNGGMVISMGSGNIIEGNTINNNDVIGIDLSSSQSEILENSISSNGIDISIGASSCIIRDNSISNSKTYGVYGKPSSSSNMIFNNSFTGKGMYHAKEDGNNQWDDGVSLGNYWDDYYGPDPDYDNNLDTLDEGDFYYTIGGVCDNYPKGVFQQPPEISSPSPSHLEESVDLRPTLSVKVVDPDPEPYTDRLDVYFYYILNNESHLIDVVSQVKSGTRASVPFFSPAEGQHAVYTYIGTGYDYICVWHVVVKDQYSETKSDEWIFSTLNVPIDNEKPTADPGGPYEGDIGEQIHFDGSGSNDTDGTIMFYRWSFGDGTSAINVKSPVHVYQNPGDYTVSLVVIDNDGASSTSSIDFTIEAEENDPPVANANGPYKGTLGQSIQFSSTGSYDPDAGDSIFYSWNFGDETIGTGLSPTHSYSKIGNYTVKLTVTDTVGLTDTDSTYILISSLSKDETSGFELILAIISILFVFIWRRKRNI